MIWQVVAIILSFLLFPLILAFANHKWQQRRDREARQRNEHDALVSRHKEACGALLDGARQTHLAITLSLDRHQSVVAFLLGNDADSVSAAREGIARIRQAARVLQVEPGTAALTDAARAFCLAASTRLLATKDALPYLTRPDQRTRVETAMKAEMATLTSAVETHLLAIEHQPAPARRRWWSGRGRHKTAGQRVPQQPVTA